MNEFRVSGVLCLQVPCFRFMACVVTAAIMSSLCQAVKPPKAHLSEIHIQVPFKRSAPIHTLSSVHNNMNIITYQLTDVNIN